MGVTLQMRSMWCGGQALFFFPYCVCLWAVAAVEFILSTHLFVVCLVMLYSAVKLAGYLIYVA